MEPAGTFLVTGDGWPVICRNLRVRNYENKIKDSRYDLKSFVDVPDELSISLLQKRLNEIDGTVAVKVLGLEDLNGREPYFN